LKTRQFADFCVLIPSGAKPTRARPRLSEGCVCVFFEKLARVANPPDTGIERGGEYSHLSFVAPSGAS